MHWKSTHGLKHQTLDIAHGITIDLFGPTSLRRNDLELLRNSRINEHIGVVQAGDVDHVKIFGDSAYKVCSHMRSYYQYKLKDLKNLLTDDEYTTLKDCNYKMKIVRISIEWNSGMTAKIFRYIQNTDKLKIMQRDGVSKIYTVATLFRNFHVAKYGGQPSNYFSLPRLPYNFLDAYINQTPLYSA